MANFSMYQGSSEKGAYGMKVLKCRGRWAAITVFLMLCLHQYNTVVRGFFLNSDLQNALCYCGEMVPIGFEADAEAVSFVSGPLFLLVIKYVMLQRRCLKNSALTKRTITGEQRKISVVRGSQTPMKSGDWML